MLIYSNSCSYGVLSDGQVYSDIIARNLDAKLINHGLAGGCNERIFRTSTRDIVNAGNNYDSKEILVLIGLTNTFRGEYWATEPSTHQDGHFQSFTASDSTGVAKKYQQEYYRIYNQEAAITNLLHQLVMFVRFLKYQGVNYLIWSNTPHLKSIDWSMDFVNPFYKVVAQDPNILSLFDFNFCDFAQKKGYPTMDKSYDQGGHPNSQAHKDFADFLMTKIIL